MLITSRRDGIARASTAPSRAHREDEIAVKISMRFSCRKFHPKSRCASREAVGSPPSQRGCVANGVGPRPRTRRWVSR